MSILDDSVVCGLLHQAWQESQPGTPAAHEEGGFILRDHDASLIVERWPRGFQNEIEVPEHADGKRGSLSIIATFHTHPNTGHEFQQEPSLTDIRAVRDDPELKSLDYEGEYVISSEWIYLIRTNGQVELVVDTRSIIGIQSP